MKKQAIVLFSLILLVLSVGSPRAQQQQQVYVAGAFGVVLHITPNTQSQPPVNLTGATINLTIVAPGGAKHTVTATVVGGGTAAEYTTISTDFPAPGVYQLQLVPIWGSTANIPSAPFQLTVTARL